MAAPAVGCTDKEDWPGVAHFRPFSLLCRYPDPPPQVVPPSPGFWVHVGLPGQTDVYTLGIRQARALQEASCVPAAFGSDAPTSDCPFLGPARVVRAPGLPGPLCPETRLGVAFGSCRAVTPSWALSPGQVFSAGELEPVLPIKQAQLEDLLPWLFPVTAHEAQPSGTLNMAVLYFDFLVYNLATQNPNSRDTSLLKEKGHRI